MNFKDVEVGQILTRIYENEYAVLEFLNDDGFGSDKKKSNVSKLKNDLYETVENVSDVAKVSNNRLIRLSPKI